jgi:hypothetical protein
MPPNAQEDSSINSPKKDDGDRRVEQITKAHTKQADGEKIIPNQPSRIRRFASRHFPEAQAHDLLNLIMIMTGVIAISTLSYAVFAGWTLKEIHSSSVDTRNLALAAGKQASAAEVQAQKVPKLAEVAIATVKETYGAKVNLNRWMGLYRSEREKKLYAIIRVQNDGKGNASARQSARNTIVCCCSKQVVGL